MFADCPAPDLTTVGRANARDGFAHFRGGGRHAPESVNHRQGKVVVARWLRHLYGDDAVAIEAATDTQRSRVADVLLTHPKTRRRVAFEVQYAQLSVAEWRERHESYVRQGVIDVWLWGHTRIRASRSEHAFAPYRLDDVQDELRKAGMRVTFINPELAQLAVAIHRSDSLVSLARKREVDLLPFELQSIRLSDDGVRSDAIDPLVAASRAWDVASAEQKLAAEQRRQELAAAAAASEASRARQESEHSLQRVQALRERLAATKARAAARPEGAQPSAPAERLRCRQCGLPLDPLLAESGVHLGPCTWKQDRQY
ncbi:competence protein CoiA family protein [Agromyces sp. NPDC056965]|uniref:competence protein CoiA family protein n=1 Tax=Agromyces sp. NPDC056965 TaxID=3345983 RepID=UPI003636CFC2